MKVKVESEKVGLKLNIQKMKIIASSPITSWEIDGETVETVSDFIFWAPKSLHQVSYVTKWALAGGLSFPPARSHPWPFLKNSQRSPVSMSLWKDLLYWEHPSPVPQEEMAPAAFSTPTALQLPPGNHQSCSD